MASATLPGFAMQVLERGVAPGAQVLVDVVEGGQPRQVSQRRVTQVRGEQAAAAVREPGEAGIGGELAGLGTEQPA
ncbi:hypothetical protein [Klenkia taihuensis]|uniref:Uncharacterized protein n=1 Tax=Klenkia taihuensis TaxID=1225127 RepID=A0A1I1IBT8_9ACTN|nr:hypothetical protein [Klenkia taihuensis]GHE08709.1 hypothetical protein GCM10011381_10240 [Klenkia taihuensis]SFC33727.1 hypothetical protein SAMN05661030_0710 [Klenkia taihuensis]